MIKLPIFETEETDIKEDSNFNAISRKIAFKKQLKSTNRNEAFEEIIKGVNGLPKKK